VISAIPDGFLSLRRKGQARPHVFFTASLLAALAFTAFTLWLALGVGGLKATVAVDDVGEGAASAVAALACAFAAARATSRSRRDADLCPAPRGTEAPANRLKRR